MSAGDVGSVLFPCGCFLNPVVVEGRRELHLSCTPDCRIVALAIEEAQSQSTPVELREPP